MLELVGLASTVAGILGVSAKDLKSLINGIKNSYTQNQVNLWTQNKRAFSSQAIINRFLVEYYGEKDILLPYTFDMEGKTFKSQLYTNNNLTRINREMNEISMEFDTNSSSLEILGIEHRVAKTIARLEALGVSKYLFDGPIYALSEIKENEIKLKFSLSNYFKYRFTSGLLEDELVDGLIHFEGNTTNLMRNKDQYLPIRNQIASSISSILQVNSRICHSGIVCGFVMRTKDDFQVVYQQRSENVGDKAGAVTLIPRAFHSHTVDVYEEANMKWSVFREVFEEIFGGKEVEKDSAHMSHDWYFEENEKMRWFSDHDAFQLDALTAGFNTLEAGFSLSGCLCVLDSWYYEKYGKSLQRSWESANIRTFSTKNTAFIREMLQDHNLLGDTKAHLVDVLLRLKEIDPKRVSLPDLVRH